jgi:hypothetical protein
MGQSCTRFASIKDPSHIMNDMFRIVPAVIATLVSACAIDSRAGSDCKCTSPLLGVTPPLACWDRTGEGQSPTAARGVRAMHEPGRLQVESVTRGGCFRIQLDPDGRGGLGIPSQVVCPVAGLRPRDER